MPTLMTSVGLFGISSRMSEAGSKTAERFISPRAIAGIDKENEAVETISTRAQVEKSSRRESACGLPAHEGGVQPLQRLSGRRSYDGVRGLRSATSRRDATCRSPRAARCSGANPRVAARTAAILIYAALWKLRGIAWQRPTRASVTSRIFSRGEQSDHSLYRRRHARLVVWCNARRITPQHARRVSWTEQTLFLDIARSEVEQSPK